MYESDKEKFYLLIINTLKNKIIEYITKIMNCLKYTISKISNILNYLESIIKKNEHFTNDIVFLVNKTYGEITYGGIRGLYDEIKNFLNNPKYDSIYYIFRLINEQPKIKQFLNF